MRSDGNPECTLVVETFNYLEGTSLDSVRNALRAAIACTIGNRDEVVLADVTGDAELAGMIAEEFPAVRYLDAVRAVAIGRGERGRRIPVVRRRLLRETAMVDGLRLLTAASEPRAGMLSLK